MSLPLTHAVVALDVSGSTSGAVRYWDEVRGILTKAVQSHTRVDVVAWGDSAKEVTTPEAFEYCGRRSGGGGGTSPSCFVDKLATMHSRAQGAMGATTKTRLIVVTDGEIDPHEVDRAAGVIQALPANTFEHADVHIIPMRTYYSSTNEASNASVGCAFVRDVPHTITVSGSAAPPVQVTREDMEVLNTIDSVTTLEGFETAISALERVLQARLMGTNGNPEIHTKLVEMRKRLVKELAKRGGAAQGSAGALTKAVADKDMDKALEACRSLVHDYYDGAEDTLECRVGRLIDAAKGSLRRDFRVGALSHRVNRAPVVHEAPPEMVPERITDPLWVCPVQLSEGTPVVLLAARGSLEEGEVDEEDGVAHYEGQEGNHIPLMHGISKNRHESILNCPLSFLSVKGKVDAITKDVVDHVVSLEAFKGLCGMETRLSPFTRRPLVGAVTLGEGEEHAKFTDAALAQVFFGGRLTGNRDLWFYVFLCALERATYIEPTIKDQARAHMRWRLKNRKAPASLWGTATLVTTRVSLEAALFFATHCAVASNYPIAFEADKDPMRVHAMNSLTLFKVMDSFGVPVSADARRYAKRVGLTFAMLSAVKRDYQLARNEVRARTQNHVRLPNDGGLVFLDGPFTPAGGEKQLKSDDALARIFAANSAAEVEAALKRVSPQLSAGDIPIPIGDLPLAGAATATKLWNYANFSREEVLEAQALKICPATMRPYYFTGKGSTWKRDSIAMYGMEPKALFPAAKLYGDYVVKNKKFPSPTELLEFSAGVMSRSQARGNPSTLPFSALAFCEATVKDFEEAKREMPVEEFVRRFRASHDVDARVKMEKEE
jgi:hypothetical protein